MKAGTHRTVRVLMLIGALTALAGCALPGSRGMSESSPTNADLVAQNLVYTLTQVPHLHPLKTTLQISEPNTEFGKRVVSRLADAGYGLQQVAADQGPHFVRYRSEHAESETGVRRTYSIAVGDVSVERDYESNNGKTIPGSAQRVDGFEVASLETNDDIFDGEFPDTFRHVGFVVVEEPEIRDMRLASMRPAMDGVVTSPYAAPGIAQANPSSEFGTTVKRNMEEIMRSNYADLFADYEDIQTDTLVFPNDSLRLGEENKTVIAQYVKELDPATDVLSVIGCSHGRTEINNGNELLAIGRANRVKEAFMFAGIEHDQVLDESCWAGHYHAGFPRRGVILTLKRKRDVS